MKDKKFEILVIIIEAVILLCFGLFVEYDEATAHPNTLGEEGMNQQMNARLYPFF
jgi:hypothetical protein